MTNTNPHFIVSIGVGFGDVLTGGVLALHKLAFELANRGCKVTIFTTPEYPHPNINVEYGCSENNLDFEYDPNTSVIIPSFDWENKTDLKHVARWALYHIDSEKMTHVKDTDFIFNFGTFDIHGKSRSFPLTVFDYHEKDFVNHNLPRNSKYCYILNKETPDNYQEILRGLNAESVEDWKLRGNFKYLSEKFNEYEFFVTFDSKSFYTLAAAMCGCKPIIIKQDDKSPEEYRQQNPIQKFGIAYGFEDVEWMEKTLNEVPNYIKELQDKDSKTINDFVNFWKERML